MSEWVKSAKVGDKVVCISRLGAITNRIFAEAMVDPPSEGSVYTIAEIGHMEGEPVAFVRLVEFPLVNHPRYRPGQPRFGANHFRPVSPRKTDISVFTDLLNTDPVEVLEEA
jgi:hypothetical protein